MAKNKFLDQSWVTPYRAKPTEHELLMWEICFRREGTLPPEAQRRILEHFLNRPI